jgi:hypothetical protein
MKSNGIKTGASGLGGGGSANDNDEADGGFEFHIVSLDNKQWFFEANSADERDEWVAAIEQQILNSLQVNHYLIRNVCSCSFLINSLFDIFSAMRALKPRVVTAQP